MMSYFKFNPRTAVLLLFIVVTAAVRVVFNFNHDISPIANFSPLGAMALFGGSYFTKKGKAFGFPLLTLFFSDVLLHQTVFKEYGNGWLYNGWYWVYGAFLLMTLVGRQMLRTRTVSRFFMATLACVLIHWLVTDLGVWLGSKTYAQTPGGFVDCLVAALPFELRFLTGTLVYGILLFAGFEWMQRRYAVLSEA